MRWTQAIRILALLCVTQTTTAFLTERTRCTFVDIITCWFNPCRASVCPLYPEARCSLVYMRCGCRAIWHTSFGQVDCNGPPRIRVGLAPAVRVAPVATAVQRVVPERRPLPQNDCPPEVMRVRCREDPCMHRSCRSMPDAVCRPNFCGGCMAEYFRDGMRVQCGKTSFPELIDPASVMVKDRSAYTNSKGRRQPPPITQPGPDPFTQVPGPAQVWTGPQVLQPSPSFTQPPSPWTDDARITQVSPRTVATDPRVVPSSVSRQSTIPQNSRSQSSGDAALALQQNVFGLGALFPDENNTPRVSSASQPGGPLPTNSMDNTQVNFGSRGQTGQASFSTSSGVVPPPSLTATRGTVWQARQGQGLGQGENNLAAWRARSGATGSTLDPRDGQTSDGQTSVVGTSLGPLPSERGLFVPTTAESCPAGTSPAVCSSHPCTNQTCHIPGATCVPNACGSCFARWYLNGVEVDCSPRCKETQITASCPRNPCAEYSCPAHPDAVCRYSKCSSCRAEWFIGNRKVDCEIPWSASPCPPDQTPTCRCFYNHCQTDTQARCRVTGCGSNCGTEFYKVTNNSVVVIDCPVQKGQWSRNPQ